jgi:hypothetical protein
MREGTSDAVDPLSAIAVDPLSAIAVDPLSADPVPAGTLVAAGLALALSGAAVAALLLVGADGPPGSSAEASVWGVPVAWPALGYFAAATALHTPAAWRSRSRALRGVRLLLGAVGAAALVYLFYVELLHSQFVCLWCTGLHLIAGALAVLTALGTGLTAPTGC